MLGLHVLERVLGRGLGPLVEGWGGTEVAGMLCLFPIWRVLLPHFPISQRAFISLSIITSATTMCNTISMLVSSGNLVFTSTLSLTQCFSPLHPSPNWYLQGPTSDRHPDTVSACCIYDYKFLLSFTSKLKLPTFIHSMILRIMHWEPQGSEFGQQKETEDYRSYSKSPSPQLTFSKE